ncbi:DNA cytosine methyltransferase [Nostoc sp. FACHB-87]|uniref:DNA cytosine methyltransferase n=1 Tax=Nostocaceae TaxID=1162 RepID=UPI00168693F9|nr:MULTISPECIES: DNA cytosine methyltransferase [Nostocaceae]MBD2457315.1 DNA cytosine methyltransferase [Nostoc sp. FACHB-87]MBD2478384.1 DNA cytosine methyltransferase [Anabaena sp. FACHB-83]
MISVLSLFSGIGGLCHHGISVAEVWQSIEVRSYQPGVLTVAHGISVGVPKTGV